MRSNCCVGEIDISYHEDGVIHVCKSCNRKCHVCNLEDELFNRIYKLERELERLTEVVMNDLD